MIVPLSSPPVAAPLQLAAEKGGSSGYSGLLLLVALMVFTYFVLVRPQSKRKRLLQQTQASLEPGAEVMTTAGLYATIVDFDDDTVTLETAPGVHNRYVRAAVAKIVTPLEHDAADDAAIEGDDALDEGTVDDIEDQIDNDGEAPEDASRLKKP